MVGMLETKVVISELAFDVLMELEVKQDRPLVLRGPSPGKTWAERREYVQQVVTELQEAGLAEDDEPHPDLVAALTVLAQPLQQVQGMYVITGEKPSMFLSAITGEVGVFACLHDGRLSLEPIPAHALTEPLTRYLPELRPLPGQSLRVPVAAIESSSPNTYAGRGGTETEQVRQLLALPHKGVGQFSAALRDQTGRWHHSKFPLNCFDTEQGCYLTRQYQPSSSGGPWVSITPADARTVAFQAYQTLTTLRQLAAPRP